MDGDNKDLLFMRVTLLGMSGSGKTSLANAYVNNVSPTTYQRTDEQRLFYTVMRAAGRDDSSAFSVLCELEDTPGSERCDDLTNFYDLWWPSREEESRKQKDGPKWETHEPTKTKLLRSPYLPFTTYNAPLSTDPREQFNPLTKNRMAYFLVFDATDNKSYLEALRLHAALRDFWTKKQYGLKPIVFLVANKVDKDPLSDQFQSVINSAKMYSEFNGVLLHEVSALQYNGVKKLFRAALQAVRINQALYIMDVKTKTADADDSGAKCNMQ